MDFPRFSGRGIGSFGGMFFELSRACEVEGGMAPERIVELVDMAAKGPVRSLTGVEEGPPDELGVIIDRAILAAAIRMVDQPCCRTAHGQGFAQSGKSQVAMQPVAGCPANDPSCEQVDDDGGVQPALAGPHAGDVGAPLLVGRGCGKS
jgi:hypothetical protein